MRFQQTHNQGLRQLFFMVSSAPSSTHLTVSLLICDSGSNARGESRGPWRAQFQLKKPFKGLRQRQRSCWEDRKRKLFRRNGSLICPPGKSMLRKKKETEKIELVANFTLWLAVPVLTGTRRARSRKLGGSPHRPSLPGLQTQTRFWSLVFCLLFMY